MSSKGRKGLFTMGQIVATPGALEALGPNEELGLQFLLRHAGGDWGDLCAEDKAENDLSVEKGLRILSAYTLPDGQKLLIITEADRSATTLRLSEEH